VKFYQHKMCFSFALLRKSFTFPFHYVFIPLFVIIKLKLRTNLINTSVCALVDNDLIHFQGTKICRLWHCSPSYYGPYESTWGLKVYTHLLWWHHCGQLIISVCLSQKTFFPVIHWIAQLNVMLIFFFEVQYHVYQYYDSVIFPTLDFKNVIFLLLFLVCIINDVSWTSYMKVLWSRIGA
jgi:hypothetical protein